MGDESGVINQGPAIRDGYPEFVEAGNVYEMIAKAHLDKGDKPGAIAELSRYMKAGGRNPAVFKQLAELQTEAGEKLAAAETLDRLNYIYPVNDEQLHRDLGDLWFDLGEVNRAVREYGAVVAMHPLDQAASQYNLAKAYHAADRPEEAFDHVIQSLEAAPGYRPAQEMLLELSSRKKE